MEFVIYILILIFSVLSIINIGGFGLRIKMNCTFFLVLWWCYYFWIKIPYFIYNENYQPDFLYISLLVVLVFFIGFFISTLFKPYTIKLFSMSNSFISNVRFLNVLFLFLLLMLVVCTYNYSKYGTLNFFKSIASMKENRESVTWGGTSVYLSYLFNGFSKIIALLCITIAIERKRYFFAFFMCMSIMVLSLQGGSKYALLWVLYPIAIYSLITKPVSLIKLSIPILSLVSLMPIINIYRDVGNVDVDKSYLLSILLKRSDLFNGIYDLVVHVHEKGGYELGYTIYSIFFRFIPREIYPDRLGSSDAFMTQEIYNQGFWIFNFGGIGEFYFNFGMLGVFFIGCISGYIIKVINNTLMNTVDTNKVLFSAIIASPFWSMPWGIGFNVYFTDLFIFWLISIPLTYYIVSIIFKVKIK